MSGKQKVLLILVAVVLVVLFVVAVGGRDPGQGEPNGQNPFVAWLAKLGGKQAAIPAELVTATCLQPDHHTLRVNVGCTLHVDDPKSLKLLVLRSATAFGVSAPAPGNADFITTDTVSPKDGKPAEARIAVDKPADIGVTCAGTNPCILTIGDE
jgi:hypothetical protein